MKKRLTIVFLAAFLLLLSFSIPKERITSQEITRLTEHNLNQSFNPVSESDYLPYSEFRQSFSGGVGVVLGILAEKTILFNNAFDLYNWSQDLAYSNESISEALKQALISTNAQYGLGADIDYGQMRSRRFMPIGYSVGDSELVFKGLFDGRGFEITDLYYESFASFTTIIENQIVVFSEFFSMFTKNEGTIKNFGLINPTIDLENEHVTLRDFSYVVGDNSGTVESVYVIDDRAFGSNGMNIIAVKTANPKRAAGLVHTNKGIFKNSFFSGISVVTEDFMHAITEEPLYYFETTPVDQSVIYNNTNYMDPNIVPLLLRQEPENGNYNTQTEIQTGSSQLLDDWHYYPSDGFPKRYGLTLNQNDNYLIFDARDFITFSVLITLKSEGVNEIPYNDQTFIINNDINMKDVSEDAFKMSENEFSGTLTGSELLMPQINHLTIKEGLNIEEGYYLGIFYLLAGSFTNIRLNHLTIKPAITANYSGQMFYVGAVAAKLNGGTIKNVSIRTHLDFKEEGFKIGSYVIGSLVGEASGHIEKVFVSQASTIDFGQMNYLNTDILINQSYLGGVVGKTGASKLTLYNILNKGDIKNLDANNLYYSTTNAYFYVGGVIGYVNNTSIVKHNLGLLTNQGEIHLTGIPSSRTVYHYLGGVIGYSTGNMYQFSDVYGLFTNLGDFDIDNSSNNQLYLAGVVNSNHSEAVEFTQIKNDNNIEVSHTNVVASVLVNHFSNNKLIISQGYSSGNLNYNSISNTNVSAGIYTANINAPVDLNFVNIQTDLTVSYPSYTTNISVAGVTLNENTNFLNVVYGGTLEFEIYSPTTSNNTGLIWISGITRKLTSGKIMKNSQNEGKMFVYAETSNTSNTVVKNLYVAGLVNLNEAGDLHTLSETRPKASQGIINSLNLADITSYFKNYQGITGRINTFVGGITSINSGSIQDVFNAGDIRFANNTSGSEASFVEISGDEMDAGRTVMYKSGVVIGGITAIVLSGYSRIYDVINNGNILAQSYYYARSGGILGVVSPYDVGGGAVEGYEASGTNLNVVLPTHLKHSVISNGLNYGNIYAVTAVIGVYNTANLNQTSENTYYNSNGNDTWPDQKAPSISFSTRRGTPARIALHSAAGGIIGSGLSVLKRMLNHGQIGATDGAGGIIGSIFIYANTDWQSVGRGVTAVGVTMVNINTAINYGDVRAIKIHSNILNNNYDYYNQIYNKTDGIITDITDVFYDYDADFITPTNPRSDIRRLPEHKRGFGGIIGRIQRGGNQNMITQYVGFTTGTDLSNEEGSFDFIVNMNPNVDLIGRLDQNYNYSLSGTAFQIYDAVYYSAKTNDQTQSVFTGFWLRGSSSSATGYFVAGENASVSETYSGSGTRRRYTYTFSNYTTVYQNARINVLQHQVGQRLYDYSTVSNLTQVFNGNSIQTSSSTPYTMVRTPTGVFVVTSTFSYVFDSVNDVPFITETPSQDSSTYVYHDNFVMRDEETTLTTGEPITSYIYYAENDLLATRFQAERSNGMYVLSTTSGSTFGSVLPRNFEINKLRNLVKEAPNQLDYQNVSEECLDLEDDSFEDLFILYEKLYQTFLNDKSDLLLDDQYITLKDDNIGTLYYDEFVGDDFENKTITIVVDKLLLDTQRNLSFEMLNVAIPANALIARDLNSGETYQQLQTKLQTFREENQFVKIATGDLAPDLAINLPTNITYNHPYALGEFVSYSEAAVMDVNFTVSDNYYTKYDVVLIVVDAGNVAPPALNAVSVDGGPFTSNFSNISFQSNINLRFSDPNEFLPNGYIFDEYVSIYYVDEDDAEHLVEEEYYTISSEAKASALFYSLISFDNNLRNGTYKLYYKLYQVQETQSLTLEFAPERQHLIYEFRPYTSTFYENDYSDIAFGYILDTSGDFTTNINENAPLYLARYTYDISFLESFSASSYFEIESIDITDITQTADFYKEYEVLFNLKDGSTVTKYIKETELSPNYYKDNVKISSRPDNQLAPSVAENFVTREANLTTFSLVYNMENQYYDESLFTITYKYNDIIYPVTTTSQGIYFTVTNRVNIIMEHSLEPGSYEIYIQYQRDDKTTSAGNLIIEKRKGTSAYLTNIKFSEFVSGIVYPNVAAVNFDNTVINENYHTDVYYRGIDYGGADLDNHKTFRIDGEVAGIPLNEYMPLNIISYLPLGAKIQRKYYDENQNPLWTNLVGVGDLEEDIIESLTADFTLDPKTKELLFDPETGEVILPYLEYRVVSETDLDNNHNNGVTYFISVRDIKYSFLGVFTYWYFDGSDYYPITEIPELNGELLFLYIYNYNVMFENVLLDDIDVHLTFAEYPEFDEIESIKSTVVQYYLIDDETKDSYVYGFGNNFSGYYRFDLTVGNNNYGYKIYQNEIKEENQLPLFSENIPNLDGYYYYINASPVTRTVYFSIVIYDQEVIDDTWGLTDYTSFVND